MEERIQYSGGNKPIGPVFDLETSRVCLNASNPILTATSDRARSSSDWRDNLAVKKAKPPAITVETNTEIKEATAIESDGCLSSNDIISRHPSIIYLSIGLMIGALASIPAILIMLFIFSQCASSHAA
jgi:hypothetical protein